MSILPSLQKCIAPSDTFAVGVRVGKDLVPGSVVLLVGPLGAGKTILAKGIARGLGIGEELSSPTYTIISAYRWERGWLHHVDLYRIESRDQLENLGLEDVLRDDSIVIVEWGEKLAPLLDTPYTKITFTIGANEERNILIEEHCQ